MPAEKRRDIQRLQAYPEGTAGAVMTTEVARLPESLTVRAALEELSRIAENLETIYYIYIVDDENHLRGAVSARQLVTHLNRPNMPITDLMERNLVTVEATDDQEAVAAKVADYDFLAIPVVDHEQHLVGIITHDDVIDVLQQEATEDAYLAGAVGPTGGRVSCRFPGSSSRGTGPSGWHSCSAVRWGRSSRCGRITRRSNKSPGWCFFCR